MGESPPGSVSPSTQTADPSATLRFGRDDKVKGSGLPWLGWRVDGQSQASRVHTLTQLPTFTLDQLPTEELTWTSLSFNRL
jgi:hypothetical protein